MSGQWRQVRTQSELEQVVDAGDFAEIVGAGYFRAYGSATVEAYGSATVEAYGSATVEAYDSATVEAYDSATVEAYDSATVEAYGSATVRAYGSATITAYGSATVEAYGSATVRAYDSATVRAYGSATVEAYGSATVEAYGSATVRAYGSATVEATPYVAVHKKSGRARVTGGVVIEPPDLTAAANWLAYYGIQPDENGIVTLYKAVRDNWLSDHGADYQPGGTPEAPDWKPTNECGFGLHFSPRPHMALSYAPGPKFVACPVAAAELIPIGSAYDSDKVKARRVEQPGCYEVDVDGNRIEQASRVAS